jgi:hypothetical protein
MKIFFILLAFFTLVSFISRSGVPQNSGSLTIGQKKQDSMRYKVYKIDSVNNYYILYARYSHSVFKIISKKETGGACKGIVVNGSYKFHLTSILSVNGVSIVPSNQIYELSGWKIDNATTISFEGDSIRDLFYADNIKGLCFTKNKSKH